MSLETSCLDNGISSIVTLDISTKRRIERTRERSYISDRHLDQEVYCKCEFSIAFPSGRELSGGLPPRN